jgi:deoxyadenosine/deoxycytidine kinase
MKSVAVIGNIGSGKSDLAQALAEQLDWNLVQEPVEMWRECGFLQAYYDDMKANAFSFQCFAFITRRQHYVAAGNADRVYDSHIVTDPAFVRSFVAQGIMTAEQQNWYDITYAGWESVGEPCAPDLYLYLRAEPTTCHRRILSRNRGEETDITVEYLEHLGRELEATVAELGDKAEIIDAELSADQALDQALAICRARF